ncbi:DUF202 domain-containing protein [Spirulina subsalsa FACHB-351]|uniref:DUF202 domain-containing protein n=1 Tax=Spirulina subsalsa FACHB-351 TaxID=234711 RepID=A0ABT3L310_9CYAN|nr:DUF202 domain-containing protein [Spirulina subsalsa]MCW6035837.1 DUF202 domain-containing protein [Spirulina subsalsa FACHB-351]
MAQTQPISSGVHLASVSREEKGQDTHTPYSRAQRSPSRIRDHLANERTYLAWMRTAIALMGFGIVIARLRYLISPEIMGNGQGWMIGLLFASIGWLTVLLSTQHYFSIRQAIEEDCYEPISRWVILFSISVLLLGTGVLYVLFVLPLETSRLLDQ